MRGEGFVLNMATLEGSLEDEALKRRERLKALRKKSGLPDEQVFKGFKITFDLSAAFHSLFFLLYKGPIQANSLGLPWCERTCDFMFVCLVGSCRGLVIV